ncbi:hypothetical protein MTO96_016065 [Rhipicephalus appendiculatus]
MYARTLATVTLGLTACLLPGTAEGRGGLPYAHICGPGQRYLHCGSHDCSELTCDHMTRPENCTIECLSGCFCAEQLYRNKHGRCVTFDECLGRTHHSRRQSAEESINEPSLTL